NADDAYESRFWLADSLTSVVLVEAEIGQIPSDEDVQLAQRAARDVRDSNDNDTYLQPAGLYVLNAAQAVVKANYKAFDDSSGSRGFPEVKEVKVEKYQEA